MNAYAFGQEVLGRLRESLERSPYRDLTFESLRLEDNDGDYDLVALFRHVDYPGCLFGYYWTRIYGSVLDEAREQGQQDVSCDEAHYVVGDFLDNLAEEVYAGNGDLPKDCQPDSVTWITPRPYVPNSP